jgi:hypothetical protein
LPFCCYRKQINFILSFTAAATRPAYSHQLVQEVKKPGEPGYLATNQMFYQLAFNA